MNKLLSVFLMLMLATTPVMAAHVIDSKGKYRFLDDDDSQTEIREVTKFSCTGFSLSFDQYHNS